MNKKPKKPAKTDPQKTQTAPELHCSECDKVISAKDQALFVEEEVGRYFCSEACIVANFTPEIEKLEREYGRHVSANDLSSEERERYAHFRWMALEQPDEVWCEKTLKGDLRHTLIAQYRPEKKNIWAVSICLMLRGEPSFLYLAFVTSDAHLVDHFRKGDKLKGIKKPNEEAAVQATEPTESADSDRLADSWTEADSLRVSILKNRNPDDIAIEDFGFYQNCLEETLQDPNELWSDQQRGAKKVYYFIKQYEHDSDFWYVVIAKDTVDQSQIEIVDAFPTNDSAIVQMCRQGKKEVLQEKSDSGEREIPEVVRRTVH